MKYNVEIEGEINTNDETLAEVILDGAVEEFNSFIADNKPKEEVLVVFDSIDRGKFFAYRDLCKEEEVYCETIDMIETDKNIRYFYTPKDVIRLEGRQFDKVFVEKRCVFSDKVIKIIPPLVCFDYDKIETV